jgi:hypothetical protein
LGGVVVVVVVLEVVVVVVALVVQFKVDVDVTVVDFEELKVVVEVMLVVEVSSADISSIFVAGIFVVERDSDGSSFMRVCVVSVVESSSP